MTLHHWFVVSRRLKTNYWSHILQSKRPGRIVSETSNYSLDFQIKVDEVETPGHTPVSEEKSIDILVRKPKGKTIIEENIVVCVKQLV